MVKQGFRSMNYRRQRFENKLSPQVTARMRLPWVLMGT